MPQTLTESVPAVEDDGTSPTMTGQPLGPVQGTEGIQSNDDWGFDEMMQNYIDLGTNVEVPVWDSLFTDFDSYRALASGGNEFF